MPMLCKKSVCFRLRGSIHAPPPTLFCGCQIHRNRFRTMVGMIFKPKNKSPRHSLSFRNKLTLLPFKTYAEQAIYVKMCQI